MEKATIYDYARMCKVLKNDCGICPMSIGNNGANELCVKLVMKHPDKANEIILNWCKEHPVQTRQDRFLKMFPNAETKNGVVELCPNRVEKGFNCGSGDDCDVCYAKYWLAEVDENE